MALHPMVQVLYAKKSDTSRMENWALLARFNPTLVILSQVIIPQQQRRKRLPSRSSSRSHSISPEDTSDRLHRQEGNQNQLEQHLVDLTRSLSVAKVCKDLSAAKELPKFPPPPKPVHRMHDPMHNVFNAINAMPSPHSKSVIRLCEALCRLPKQTACKRSKGCLAAS